LGFGDLVLEGEGVEDKRWRDFRRGDGAVEGGDEGTIVDSGRSRRERAREENGFMLEMGLVAEMDRGRGPFGLAAAATEAEAASKLEEWGWGWATKDWEMERWCCWCWLESEEKEERDGRGLIK
jgi:hypothetical protein